MIRRALRWGRTSVRWLVVSLVTFALGASAGAYVAAQAANQSLDPPHRPATYVVESGSLGRTVTFPGIARWDVAGIVFAPAGGVVTDLNAEAGAISPGAVLIRLNERPMVAVPGDVPAFRALAEGVAGRDVRALNAYLASLGYSVDAGSGLYDDSTVLAVRAWQEQLGVPASGEVELGDIIFLSPQFIDGPPFRLASELTVGAMVSQGVPLLERLESIPAAVIEFGGIPPDEVAPGLSGVATFSSGDRVEITVGEASNIEGRTLVQLIGPAGEAVCAPSECIELVPPVRDVSLSVELTLVPGTSGAVVPSAAILSDASGDPFVTLADGTRRDVEILVSDGGLTIARGLQPGDELRLP